MVMDKMHARARQVYIECFFRRARAEPCTEGLVQLLPVSQQRVGPEKVDCGWARWNEIVLLVMGRHSSYLNG